MADDRPLLVLAGVDKAGTSTLTWALRQHPDIDKWEWIDDQVVERRHRGDRPATTRGEVVLIRDNRLFADERAPTRLDATGRKVTVFASLRDPIRRVESLYQHRRAMGRLPTNMGIDDFIRVQLRGEAPPATDFRVVVEGRYADYLPPWREALGDRIRVLLFEEWVADALAATKEMLGACGLDPQRMPSLHKEQANPSGDARFPRVSRFTHLATRKLETVAGRVGKRDAARDRFEQLRQWLYVRTVRSTGHAPRLDPGLRDELAAYYLDSNRRLSEQLGRPLPWAYTSS